MKANKHSIRTFDCCKRPIRLNGLQFNSTTIFARKLGPLKCSRPQKANEAATIKVNRKGKHLNMQRWQRRRQKRQRKVIHIKLGHLRKFALETTGLLIVTKKQYVGNGQIVFRHRIRCFGSIMYSSYALVCKTNARICCEFFKCNYLSFGFAHTVTTLGKLIF